MTDRRKAILFLSLTLMIGILIGSLIPAFYGKMRYRNMMEWRKNRANRPMPTKEQWLIKTVTKVVKPDSDQMREMRPITDRAAAQIRELEKKSNEQMSSIMDSLKIRLKPILTNEQNQRLEEFSTKARQRWKRKG